MSYLSFRGVGKSYAEHQAVSNFDLDVSRGELVAILGPSGCGKTTTLRMLAGFVSVSAGTISLGDKDITNVPSYQRDIGMVFQGYALFPHLSVAKNVSFGLEMRKLRADHIAERVQRALERVKLTSMAGRLPRQLSGGQQQRVALARAIAIDPNVLLLDEPLSALDARLRHDVRQEIRQLQQESGLTTVMVTHDQDEALSMADRLVIMNQGRIEQIGTPADVYEHPANRFVAEFMGKSNFLAGTVVEAGQFLCDGVPDVLYCDTERFRVGARALLSFRPERAVLDVARSAPEQRVNALSGRLCVLTYLGQSIEATVEIQPGLTVKVLLPNAYEDLARSLTMGEQVTLSWSADNSRLLPE